MGYADIGVHGCKDIPTPHLDALAKDGVRFTNGYVTGPYCSPTRAGLLTGRYQQRFGHEFNIAGAGRTRTSACRSRETTIADRLKAAGYGTGAGRQMAPRQRRRSFHPQTRGFDEFFGFLGGAHSYFDGPRPGNPIYDGTEVGRTRWSYLTDAFAREAVAFIDRNKGRPFFLYLAFNAVHTPLQATDEYLARFAHDRGPEAPHLRGDAGPPWTTAVGRTLAASSARRPGGEHADLLLQRQRRPDDGARRQRLEQRAVPRIKGRPGGRHPRAVHDAVEGRLPAGKIYDHVRSSSSTSFRPRSRPRASSQPEWKLDGVNLLPYPDRPGQRCSARRAYWRTGDVMAIRKGDWKLVKTYPGGSMVDPGTPSAAGAKLFNLKDNSGEAHDLAGEQPARLGELRDAWQRWNSELARPAWTSMEMMITYRRSCGNQPMPANLAGYVGTWSGRLFPPMGDSAIAAFTWTQSADSAGTWRFATEATPTAARVVLASADSVLVEVTRPGAGFMASVDGAPLRMVGQACGNELLGQLRARLPGGGAVRLRLTATRSP